MGFWNSVWEGIKSFFRAVVNFIKKVINGILNFAKYVLDYFRNKNLREDVHTPFIGNEDAIKEMLKDAPKKDVGIFKGVYNQVTDKIEDLEVVEADSLDGKTKEVLGEEKLVILG